MFFDNEVKKNVNLRGQKTESKKNFVQRVEQERLQRQLQKQKQQAALKIQSIWRGTREIAKLREQARISWNPEFSSNLPLTTQLQNLTRLLLFFYRDTPSDNERLDKLCTIFLSNLSSNSKSTDPNINICYITPTNLQQWILQVKKLLVLCQKRLAVKLDIYLQLMLLLTDMGNVNTSIPNFNKNNLASKLTSYMVANGFYATMSKLLQQYLPEIISVANITQDKIALLQIFTALSVRPVQFTALNASSQFIRHILSIPSFSQRLPTSLYGPYINMLPILLASNANSIANDSTANLFLLGNLLGFSKLYMQFLEHSKNEKSVSIALLTSYIRWLSFLTKSSIPLLKNILQSESPEYLPLLEQFKNITDNKFIQIVYTNSTNNIVIESSNIYLTFLLYWKSFTVQLLNSLTFSTSLVPTLWKYLLSSSNFQDLLQNLYIESSNSNNDIANVLLLFGKCYNHLLFTMDDSEFFDFQTPFSKPQVQDMVRIIRRMVYRMYWNRDVILSETFFQLRDTLTILLHSLYDRDSRHPFCSDNTWTEEDLIDAPLENTDDRVKILLDKIPFVISFTQRLRLFYDVIKAEKQYQTQTSPIDAIRVSIRRDYLFEDGFAKLNSLNEKLKGTIRVELTSSNGTVEAGIDGGGVFKEFFTQLIKTAYNTEYGLFKETADRRLFPNPQSNAIIAEDSRQFEFLGKILGKAVYENILVELPLANFFLAKLLGKYNYVHDLVFLDPDVYKNINRLRNMDNIEDLSLTFTTMEEVFGKPELVELIPGGKDILVTNENKIKFIARMADYKLNQSIKRQSAAFLAGFQQIIPTQLLKIFNQNELQTLISGTSGGIDIEDLKKHCVYSGGYHADHPVIQRFWNVLASFSPENQHQFLMFVTSCSRAPLLGFGYLQPGFCIHQALPSGYDVDQWLPTSSTCMNFLKLPPYTSEEKLRQKLLYAITSKAGFELS